MDKEVVAVKEKRNRAILTLLPAIRKIAKQIYSHLPEGSGTELEDLVNEGVLAVLRAFKDLKKGSLDKEGNLSPEAKNYLLIRAKGAMFDYLRSLDFGAKNIRSAEKKIERVKEELRQKLGREPTEEELAAALGIPLEELVKLEDKIGFSYLLSLEEVFNEKNYKGGFEAFLPNGENVEREVEKRELLSKLVQALKKLDDREVLVLQLVFFEGLKTQDIADILNLSLGRVAQIKKRALKKLYKEMERYL